MPPELPIRDEGIKVAPRIFTLLGKLEKSVTGRRFQYGRRPA